MGKNGDFKKFWQFTWRSWAIQASWNYERLLIMGFLYGIAPTLDRLYPDEKDPQQLAHKKEAYQRHMAFYNCTPQTSAFTLGLASSMEEQYAADRENFNPDTINAVKTSLMGPLSGIGDSFFQGTIRIIAFGLGIQLAQQGSILGPILAMLISFVPSFVITWFAGKLGYTMGSKYLSKLQGAAWGIGPNVAPNEIAIGLQLEVLANQMPTTLGQTTWLQANVAQNVSVMTLNAYGSNTMYVVGALGDAVPENNTFSVIPTFVVRQA